MLLAQNGKPDTEKNKVASEWDFKNTNKIIVFLRDFNGHVGKCVEGFQGVHGGMALGKRMQKEGDWWSSVIKKSCAWETLAFIKQTKGKSFIVLVDVKQKLILCLWEKNTCKECESDFMKTSAPAGGRRSG